MPDHLQYGGGIRAMLRSGQIPEDGALGELAQGYAAACAEANERLTGCARLLSQGLRGEAIHLAEIEPNLLAMLTALDFAERADWGEFVEANGLPRAQPLNLEA